MSEYSNKRVQVGDIKGEIKITTARSGGAGGQHVNKVETKVMLRWKIGDSKCVTPLQQQQIRVANASKITKDDELIVSAEGQRSQVKNKEIAFKKLDRLLAKSFIRKKRRKPTVPSKAARQKRLNDKRRQGEKKTMRKNNFL